MVNMIRPTSKFSRGPEKNCKFSNDPISDLPGEILISILSHLTLREAARTSILSRRWVKLWTFISCLNFDASEKLEELKYFSSRDLQCLDWERRRYEKWVNKVLKSHRAPTIDEFRICFDLTTASSYHINSWIKFAITKRARRLELDFSRTPGNYQTCNKHHKFPRFGSTSLESLRALSLNQVQVTEEVIRHLLSRSPLLEYLCIRGSDNVHNLKIAGPSLSLKFLEIGDCARLESIEISAILLTSFKYSGEKISLAIQNAPQLVDLSFQRCLHGFDMCRQLSSYLPQLKKLVLNPSRPCFYGKLYPEEFSKLPTLSNLRHLELVLIGFGQLDNHPIMSLLEASPDIQRFKLELTWFDTKIDRRVPKVRKKLAHKCLKVIELVDFVGGTAEIEVAMSLIENAPSLEKLIISPFNLKLLGIDPEIVEMEKQLTRECAMQLGGTLPSGAELLLLT